jgi:hypothetical protein
MKPSTLMPTNTDTVIVNLLSRIAEETVPDRTIFAKRFTGRTGSLSSLAGHYARPP